MKVETYLFGAVDVTPEKVLNFPAGLAGFESMKQFTLVHEDENGEQPMSFTLQSLDDPQLAFQIMDPTALGFNYELQLTDEENALLQSPAEGDVVVMLMVFKQKGDKAAINPNLRAPLLINIRARVGLQKIMEEMHPNITLSNLSNPV